MGADLGVPLSDLRPLCVSVAGGESRKTFTQFSKREKREKLTSLSSLLAQFRTRHFPTIPHAHAVMANTRIHTLYSLAHLWSGP